MVIQLLPELPVCALQEATATSVVTLCWQVLTSRTAVQDWAGTQLRPAPLQASHWSVLCSACVEVSRFCTRLWRGDEVVALYTTWVFCVMVVVCRVCKVVLVTTRLRDCNWVETFFTTSVVW